MEVYHQDATPGVTGYEKVLTVELIRRYCCAHPVGTILEARVRTIAHTIGRSAGQLSNHLDQLEADGWIRRLADHTGTLIEVLRSDQAHDRSGAGAAPVELPSLPPTDMAAPSAETPHATDHADDRPSAASGCDHADDPPACMVDHDLSKQQQIARESTTEEPLYQRLVAHPGMHEPLARQVVQAGVGTLADFEADLKRHWPGVRGDVFFWLVAIWASGKRPTPRAPAAPRAAPNARPDPFANRPQPPRAIWRPDKGALTSAQIAAQLRQLAAAGGRDGS